ncbi:hypothetical protein BGZ76_006552 [Entomortierella beljakovae]|nr:hypothetical protein BGZ76_006552 [Entomortierella beljakovae]
MSPPADDDFDFGNLDALDLDMEEALSSGEISRAGKSNTQSNFFSSKVQSNTNEGNRNAQTRVTHAPQQQTTKSNAQYDEFDEFGDIGESDLLDDNDLFEESTSTAPARPTFFNVDTPQQWPPQPQLQPQQNQRASSPEVLTQPSQSPTHHVIDKEAAQTWQYPLNFPRRDYQYNIIRRALFCNTLVSLPTGLGKTFIAAVVMLNYFRWFPKSKIIFMAPTKPLVNQQIEACFNVCGIPQEVTIEMTGQMNADHRREMWVEKRVIYCTPQVLQNDINSGICPAEDIVCLVVDEAHRAVGRYSYSEVIRLLEPINRDVRIMALTATPGGDIKTVQKVIQNLKIAKIEMRTEDSMDLQQYVFKRTIQEVVVPCGKDIAEIRDKFQRLMRPFLDRLAKNNVVRTTDPSLLTRFTLIQGRDAYVSEHPQHSATKSFILKQVAICMGLIHAYELLTIHGIRPFFVNMDPASGIDNNSRPATSDPLGPSGVGRAKRKTGNNGDKDDDNKQSAARMAMNESPEFNRMMDNIRIKMRDQRFCSHPKLERLVGVVVKHFTDHQDQNDALVQARASELTNYNSNDDSLPQTRVMIFANYRESVEEIGRVLEQHRPIVKVQSFIGQATAKGKKGISQKDQQRVVADFQNGQHNVLVATSIGEEGLDIGDVDLIVCYDSHSSPIRMLQRMGRTGRKRKGRICLLLSEGQEEQKYRRAQSSYKAIQRAIAQGHHIQYYPYSPRILPPGNPPTCDLVHIEVPDYIAPSTSRKRRKVGDDGAAVGGKIRFRSAFLDPQEMARFQQRYRIPKRDIKTITFKGACAKLLENKKRSVVAPDKTFLVGHSTRTMSFIKTANKISRLRVEQSLGAITGDSRQKDSHSERMLELLEQWGHSGIGIGVGVGVVDEDSEPSTFTKPRKKRSMPTDIPNNRLRPEKRGLFSHVGLSDNDTDELHDLAGRTSKSNPTHIRRRVIVDESEDDDDEGEDDEELRYKKPTSSALYKSGQPKPKKKTTSLTSFIDKSRLLTSSRTLTKLADTPLKNTTKSNFPTISDDEVDKEIMGGLGEGFEEAVDRIDDFDGHLPEMTTFEGSMPTQSATRIIGDGHWKQHLSQDVMEKRRGFDFKEHITPPSLWYKQGKQDKRKCEVNTMNINSHIEIFIPLPFIKLPAAPEPGKWYDPISSPSKVSTVAEQLRRVDVRSKVSKTPRSQNDILFIESSEEESEEVSEENRVVKRKNTFASQAATLAKARSYFSTSASSLENTITGFSSARSVASLRHRSGGTEKSFDTTIERSTTKPEREISRESDEIERERSIDFMGHVENSHNSPIINSDNNNTKYDSCGSEFDDFELGELDLEDDDSLLLEEENTPW